MLSEAMAHLETNNRGSCGGDNNGADGGESGISGCMAMNMNVGIGTCPLDAPIYLALSHLRRPTNLSSSTTPENMDVEVGEILPSGDMDTMALLEDLCSPARRHPVLWLRFVPHLTTLCCASLTAGPETSAPPSCTHGAQNQSQSLARRVLGTALMGMNATLLSAMAGYCGDGAIHDSHTMWETVRLALEALDAEVSGQIEARMAAGALTWGRLEQYVQLHACSTTQ